MKRFLWAVLLLCAWPVSAAGPADEPLLRWADALFRRGENQEALETYRRARQVFSAAGDRAGEGYSWRGEADVLFRSGDNQKALDAYRTARGLFITAGDRLGEGSSWRGEANVLSRLGENQQALDAYRTARELFSAVGSRLGQGNTWRGEADVLLLLGEDDKALDAYRTARQCFAAVGDQLGQGNAWLGEARILHRRRDWRQAAEAAATAIASFESTGVLLHRISAFILEAEAEDRAGDVTAAAVSASAAIRLHSQWRRSWTSDRYRTDQEETISRAYDLLVPLRAAQGGQAAEALRLAEEARSRVLLDLLATRPRSAAQEQFLAAAPPLDAAAIQALARETGPLLLYYAAEREVWGFLILPGTDEIVLRRIDLSWRELGREVRSLEHDLANPLYEPRAALGAHRLWDLLIAPFSDHLPAQGPLVLVPHGPLHELPFEALLDPAGRPLYERWQVSVTPSASALDFARRRHAVPSPDDTFLAFSPGHPAEGAAVSALFPAALHPAAARDPSYGKLVAGVRHLLISTRGVHTEGSRIETYLEIRDSRLTAVEIAAAPLAAELVSLAACDTSHGQALLSDERLDLTRSFLIAGAAAVLATRWKVPEDASTDRFLIDFYRAYRQGTGLRKDEALTEARRRSRERGDPAQVWAAWVLVGDAR